MKKAFTIIELIVVVAILVLLIGIILPSLEHCRCFCLNNYTNFPQALLALTGILIGVFTFGVCFSLGDSKKRFVVGMSGFALFVLFLVSCALYTNGVDNYIKDLKAKHESNYSRLEEKLRLAKPEEK